MTSPKTTQLTTDAMPSAFKLAFTASCSNCNSKAAPAPPPIACRCAAATDAAAAVEDPLPLDWWSMLEDPPCPADAAHRVWTPPPRGFRSMVNLRIPAVSTSFSCRSGWRWEGSTRVQFTGIESRVTPGMGPTTTRASCTSAFTLRHTYTKQNNNVKRQIQVVGI